jgi:hypothetical protein
MNNFKFKDLNLKSMTNQGCLYQKKINIKNGLPQENKVSLILICLFLKNQLIFMIMILNQVKLKDN